jgi:UDP-GlcNAc3NAcA epimerase
MRKIVTIVGARPQFVKAAVLSRLIHNDGWKDKFTEFLIHTGQHYDINMSDIFFKEMDIPKPDVHLNVGSGTHGRMTGEMLIKIEEQLLIIKPDIVIVYGDTNSTLAGALAAAKLHIPVVHIEAGLRSFWKLMPEEQNRILTDHLSDWLFCPTLTSVQNLKNEGIKNSIYQVGDIMLDAHLYYRGLLEKELSQGVSRLNKIQGLPKDIERRDFVLATVHRAENTDDILKLKEIIDAFNLLPFNVVFPLHPRTRKIILAQGIQFSKNVFAIDPVGYFEMLELELKCKCIITDSGGVQKEAYFVEKPCITLRNQTEWVETVESGWNQLAGAKKYNVVSLLENIRRPALHPNFYGNGKSGESILTTLC